MDEKETIRVCKEMKTGCMDVYRGMKKGTKKKKKKKEKQLKTLAKLKNKLN